ncbi:MAG: sugar ABC transporter permease, partial [bacterium]
MTKLKFSPFLLALPAIILISIFAIYPIFQAVYLSLFDIGLLKQEKIFVGLNNYLKLFQDPVFRNSLIISLVYIAAAVVLQLFLGVGLALILNRENLFGKNIFRTIFLIPYVMSGLVISLIWAWLYEYDFGLINAILRGVGLSSIAWLDTFALPSTIITYTWWTTSFSIILLESAMKGIPKVLYESAKIDGASSLKQFVHITIPGIKSTLLITLLIITLFTLNDFHVIFILTAGGPANKTDVLGMFMWRNAFKYFDLGYGSTIAVIFLLLNFVLSGIYILGFGTKTIRGEIH